MQKEEESYVTDPPHQQKRMKRRHCSIVLTNEHVPKGMANTLLNCPQHREMQILTKLLLQQIKLPGE